VITLITGIPGSGKTLYTLCYVKQFAEKPIAPRHVYQSGIANLTLPWELFGLPGPDPDKAHETDASNWNTLPSGSVIVIDECQRLFRPRGQGAKVPEFVSALETHRHKGYDIFLVTQHPMLIDSNVRRLVGQHFHVRRLFGGMRATIFEWPSCNEVSKASLADAVRHEFRYPKEVFTWYKSAEVHTHRKRVPMRVYLMMGAPLIVAGLVWFGWTRMSHFMEGRAAREAAEKAAKAVADAQPKGLPGAPVGGLIQTKASTHLSTDEYIKAHAPRMANLPHTAPVYDEVTKYQRAPVPAACVSSASRCVCFTQDGTRMAMSDDFFCRSIVQNGYFVPFKVGDAERGALSRDAQQQRGGGLGPLETAAGPAQGRGARVGVIGGVGQPGTQAEASEALHISEYPTQQSDATKFGGGR